ncbi:MAG: nickel pincer cofactor biosynthesis protein LarC [Clostridia bacterium]|nr:nickel pincer cofactor biosynthesis protein LarC [Clostridia bacterium]
MKTLYLECFSGISGDMAVGALLDLGANLDKLLESINSINLGCTLHTGRIEKNGISAFSFDVELPSNAHNHENHSIGINDIYTIIDNSQLSDNAKSLAKKMFGVVAQAEAVVHNKPIEEVHFHEVGSADSIIDICATAFCLDDLNIDKVICSPISDGTGYINCSHGKIPVPVPATSEIARAYKIPMNITDNNGEMVTPTGAAIVAAIADEFKTPSNIIFEKIGIGAGKKDFKHPNVLRAYIIKEQEESTKDKIIVIETAIDDSTPEELSFCLKRLFKAGVKDAFYSPIYMKKNRPAWQLTVMCEPKTEQDAISIIFKHTTAVGVRKQELDRVIMNREKTTVTTKHGEVDANIFTFGDIKKTCLEYKSVKKLAKEKDCSIVDIYRNY